MQSVRAGAGVKQVTLLNLGSHFDLPREQWAALVLRIDELLRAQSPLLDSTLCEAGTKHLSQRFGPDLACVRYRQDREARRRYTTVEIVADSGPMPLS